MTTEKIKQDIIELISKLFKDNGFNKDIIESANLIDALGMDSITFVYIVVELETHFDIQIPDDSLFIEKFKTLDEIVLIVEKEIVKNN